MCVGMLIDDGWMAERGVRAAARQTKDMAKWREDTILFGGEHDVATSNYGGKTNTYRLV